MTVNLDLKDYLLNYKRKIINNPKPTNIYATTPLLRGMLTIGLTAPNVLLSFSYIQLGLYLSKALDLEGGLMQSEEMKKNINSTIRKLLSNGELRSAIFKGDTCLFNPATDIQKKLHQFCGKLLLNILKKVMILRLRK